MNSLSQCVRRALVILVASPAVLSQHIVAQSAPAAESTSIGTSLPSAPRANLSAHHVETSVSLGSMAVFAATRIKESSTDLTTQSLTPSAAVFATFRQNFKPWLGYSVNVGYTHPTYHQIVTDTTSFTGRTTQSLVPANMFEVSVSYVAEKHLTDRLTTFGEVGGGTVAFAATNGAGDFQRRSNAFRPAGVAGFGIDYQLTRGLGLRAEYRGLFIRFPYPDYDESVRLKTIISEPTLSLTYRFGRHTKP